MILLRKLSVKSSSFVAMACLAFPTTCYGSSICDTSKSDKARVEFLPPIETSGTLWISSIGTTKCSLTDPPYGATFNCEGISLFGDYLTTRGGIKLRIGLKNYKIWDECIQSSGSSGNVKRYSSWEGPIFGTNDYMKFEQYRVIPIRIITPNFDI